MKTALCIASIVGLTATSSQAEVTLRLSARIEAQCDVINVATDATRREVVVRTACNTETLRLIVGDGSGDPEVVDAESPDASVAIQSPGLLQANLRRPGVQTFTLRLAQSVDPSQDIPVAVLAV